MRQKKQVRTLLKELKKLNPKYTYTGISLGRNMVERSLPFAESILQELSNRKLTIEQQETIADILSQKTSEFAFFSGPHQAIGDKYTSLDDYKVKKQRQMRYQQGKEAQQRQMQI